MEIGRSAEPEDGSFEKSAPLILCFVADLMFASHIESAAERLSYRVEWVASGQQIAPQDLETLPRQLAEHLVGAGAALIDRLTQSHPALVILDLGNPAVPWREWLALIKSAPATRRIPVICYGPHVDVDAFQAAKGRGADAVVARSRFLSDLPHMIERYARPVDTAGLEQACGGELSALALKGLDAFNRGEYFEAHEYLEFAWNADETPGRELYRAILQVAVAYLHIERGNYNGALKMFLRLRHWIDPLPERCRGVDIASLRREARAAHEALLALGPSGIGLFDRRLMRPVRYEWGR